MAGTIRAFMYHDVRDLDETIFPKRYELRSFLRKKAFLNQIEYIKNNYTIIKSNEILNLDLHKAKENFAVLTFDDGLLDHYWVFNELKKQNVPATFCIPVLPVTKSHIIDSHAIQFIIASAGEERLVNYLLKSESGFSKPLIFAHYSQTSWKKNWWSKEMIFITNYLRSKNYTSILDLFKKFVSKDIDLFCKKLYLSVPHIEEMANHKLMTIAGHNSTSTNYIKLKNSFEDIDSMTQFLNRYSDKLMLSYPNGGYNDMILRKLREDNYKIGFTTEPKTISDLDEYDSLLFPRYDAPQKLPLC